VDPRGGLELSIVIPARNEAGTISEQLDALSAQEWDGIWEVVVVDNGSTDATTEIVLDHARSDPRVRVVAAVDRAGLNYARNTGIDASAGRNFALCDADDIVTDGWVSAMGNALREHELVTGPLELDRLNPKWLADSRGRGDERGLPSFHGIFPTVHGNNMGMQREVWVRLGRFDEDVLIGADDVELSMRAWLDGVAAHFVPDAAVHYRYRPETRALWRQGRNYGRSRPLVIRRLRERGLECPSRVAGWRSWAWLVAHLTDTRTPEGRAAWIWVAGNRLGQVEGSIRYRSLFV
jgi:Glycosyltransferases, probably involved in cell wall biogenesis